MFLVPSYFISHFMNLERHFFWRIIWVSITVFLYGPFLAQSKPLDHFDPSSLSPIQKGEFYLAQSLNTEALKIYQSLINARKGDEYAFRGMIRAYKNMDKLEEAQEWLENYLVSNLSSSAVLYGLGYINYLNENIEKSQSFFNQALELNAKNALALNNLGAIYSRQKSYNQAAEKVRAAIYINPKESMFFNNLELIYKKMGNSELIFSDYNRYLKKGVSDLVRGYGMAVGRKMRQAGFKLYSKGKLDEAIGKFMEIETVYKNIKHQTGLVPIYFSLGLLHEEKGDFKNAKKFFKQVLAFNSLHIQAKERLKQLQ